MFFSFQGFDENEGKANLELTLSDAAAFLDYLSKDYPDQNIAYVGDSISSSVALCLPSNGKRLSAIVVEGAVDLSQIPYEKLKQLWYLFPLFPILAPTAVAVSESVPDNLDMSSCLASTSIGETPALFIHHPDDTVASFRTAFDLFKSYSGPKEFLIPKAGQPPQYHTNLWRDKIIREKVVSFLQQHVSTQVDRYSPDGEIK